MIDKVLENLRRQYEKKLLYDKLFPNNEDFVDSNFISYGGDFVTRLKKYGVTEKNENLIVYPWVEEYAALIGDLRINHVATAGNAQCGKSLINTLLLCDFLIFTGLNTLWFYPTKQQVDSLVPEMFGKVIQNYLGEIESAFKKETGQSLNLIQKSDRKLISRFQVKNATAIFSYASNSARDTPSNTGLATVGSSAASVSASILFIDERSQIPPEATSILPRRLDASRLPKKITRDIGTFGSGYGIEGILEHSKHHFYPHFKCDSCNTEQELNPKGCLLLEFNGKFLSQTGRPILWNYADEDDKINSAYFCCPNCGEAIPDEKRMNAFFKCLKTGMKLKDYLKALSIDLNEIVNLNDTVFLHLSPLLRNTRYNLAANLIEIGLQSDSTKDYQQQVLGFSSETEVDKITIEMIKDSNNKIIPSENQHIYYVIAGVDQGRTEDYMTIAKYYGVDLKALSTKLEFEDVDREIIFCEPVLRENIPKILKEYKVKFGLIDNEPDRINSFDLAKHTVLETADQRRVQQIYKEVEILSGGYELKTFAIDNYYFLNLTLKALSTGKTKTTFNVNDNGIYSPTRHFTAPYKDIDGKWNRAKDKVDDLFYSFMFAEAAFYIFYKESRERLKNSVDWYRYL